MGITSLRFGGFLGEEDFCGSFSSTKVTMVEIPSTVKVLSGSFNSNAEGYMTIKFKGDAPYVDKDKGNLEAYLNQKSALQCGALF